MLHWLTFVSPGLAATLFALCPLPAALLATETSPRDRAADRHAVLAVAMVSTLACLIVSTCINLVFANFRSLPNLVCFIWIPVALGSFIIVPLLAIGLTASAIQCFFSKPLSSSSQEIAASAAEAMRLPRSPKIVVSEYCRSPHVTAVGGGTIVVPPEIEKSPAEVQRGVFMHEIGHIVRGDVWTGLAAAILAAYFWWNPFYWYALRRMNLNRELACDSAVLHGHNDRAWYADLLASCARPSLVPHMSATTPLASKSTLRVRLEELTTKNFPTSLSGFSTPLMSRAAMIFCIIAFFLFAIIFDIVGHYAIIRGQ